jgi:hypothetical protein
VNTQIGSTSEPTVPTRPLELGSVTTVEVSAAEVLESRLQLEINIALGEVVSPTEKRIAERIFNDILRVFNRLAWIESNLKKLDTLLENLSILDVLSFEIRYLVDFIDNTAMHSSAVSERLRDVLDGISYSISHDFKRIYETELVGQIRTQTTPVVYGKILHAHGLIANCFQQALITLLQVFNSKVDPIKLFDDFEERVRQSLVLCNDLSSLMRIVRQAEAEATPYNLGIVVDNVITFRDGSMQYLMYRDWRVYERQALDLITSIQSNCDSVSLLHQFNCFLEVLYGHVKMRAVLKDMFPSSGEAFES